MPDEFGTPDSMADMSTPELLEKVRSELEQGMWLNSDIDPHQVKVKVNLLINGQVQATENETPDVQVQVNNGVLTNGTAVRVTFQREETVAEVIGYDTKYRLHKVRTACGKVILRKVNYQSIAA